MLRIGENHSPIRELGFNRDHQVQIAVPKEEGYGMWCSPEIQFESIQGFETISAEDLEDKWNEFVEE